MKFESAIAIAIAIAITSALLQFAALSGIGIASAQDPLDCSFPTMDYSETIALQVEKLTQIPVSSTDPFSYNMQPFDNFDGDCIFFLDQLFGRIYSHCGGSTVAEVTKIFDMDTDTPEGLTLDYDAVMGTESIYRVKAMTQGPTPSEVIVVFSSTTLPPGWEDPDASLPPPISATGCRDESISITDIYHLEPVPDCADAFQGVVPFRSFDVFYRYDFSDNTLSNPRPFLATEVQIVSGEEPHVGGGVATLPDGDILYSTGDNVVVGLDGSTAPQLDQFHVGKILRIDPRKPRQYEVVAKGVRTSQQMRLFESPTSGRRLKSDKEGKAGKKDKKSKAGKKSKDALVFFMDIGGATAEEVNAFNLTKIDKKGAMLNFGWGRNEDGKAREGTYYVGEGRAFVISSPACVGIAPSPEDGFVEPWIQFGRTPTDVFFGIRSFSIPTAEGSMLKAIVSEFYTGQILGSTSAFIEGTTAPSDTLAKLKLYYNGDEFLDVNEITAADLTELGIPVSFTAIGDPRLFHFPDGTLGLFVERTGIVYTLEEKLLEVS